MARKPKAASTETMDLNTSFGNDGQMVAPGSVQEDNAFSDLGWKNLPQIVDMKADLEYARQESVDQANNVSGWLDLRNATGAESGRKSKLPGRSSVQPKLIRKHNEWRYPGLTEPFLNSPDLFKIRPRTYRDRDAARQNQLILNYQFTAKIRKVDWIDKYVRKTVDEGTAIVRVGWERKSEKIKTILNKWEYYPITDQQQLEVLAQATQMYMDDPILFTTDTNVPESLVASVEYSAQVKIPVYAVKVGEEEVVEERISFNQPSLKLINVKNIFIDPSCEGDWEQAQFIIYTYETTESELKKRKTFKNLDKVSWQANYVVSQQANQDHETKSPMVDTRVRGNKKKVLVYEYWGFEDIYDDGTMCPVVVSWIGDTVIQMEENPFPDRKPPFVIVPYMPISDSVFGESDASLLQDNQRISGALTRGLIDLMGRSANAQTGYAKGFLDATNKKRFIEGQDFEFNPMGDPEAAMKQMKYPDVPQGALIMNQMQQQEAEAMSGVKAFSSGITGDSFGKVARNTGAVLDAAGQREMSLLRRLAEGIKLIGQKIMMMNQVYLTDTEVVPITDEKFIEIRRERLAGDFDLICDIASAQMDDLRSQDLGMMLQTIGPDMDPGERKMILAEIAELKRMPELAHSIRTYQPQPDPMQVELQKAQLELLKAQIDEMKSRAEKNRADAENKAVDTAQTADGTKQREVIEKQGAQARGNANLEVTKALLNGETPPQHIEAAVGFNKMTERAAEMKDALAVVSSTPAPTQGLPMAPLGSLPQQAPGNGQMPLAPLQSAQSVAQNPGSLALPA